MPSSCLGVNRMGMNWLHPIWSPKRQTEPVSSTASSLLFLAGLYLSNYLSMGSMYLVSLCSISVYFCLCLCLYPSLSRSVQLSFPSESADDFDYQLELTHVLWISTRWSHVCRVEPASTAHASTCCFTWVRPEDGQLHQKPISLWVRNQPGFPAFQTGTFPTNPLSFITLRNPIENGSFSSIFPRLHLDPRCWFATFNSRQYAVHLEPEVLGDPKTLFFLMFFESSSLQPYNFSWFIYVHVFCCTHFQTHPDKDWTVWSRSVL